LPRLIGLAGPARSGKDTAANYLVANRGYTKIAFADAVRECARALNPIVGYNHYAGRPVRWTGLESAHGYEDAKDHPVHGAEFRAVLQRIGTEMGRQTLSSEIWVNTLLDRLQPGVSYVIPDCRFPNEAAAITERSGVVWRVQRDVTGSYREGLRHVSETALDEWEFDAVLRNYRGFTLEALHQEIETALRISSGHRRGYSSHPIQRNVLR
jgi:hypothetical protein